MKIKTKEMFMGISMYTTLHTTLNTVNSLYICSLVVFNGLLLPPFDDTAEAVVGD